MLRISLILCVLLQLQTTFADEPQTKSKLPDHMAKLVERMEQLENRIKELERQAGKSSSAMNMPQYQPYSTPQYYAPQPPPYISNTNVPPAYQPVPAPAAPYIPQTPPSYPGQPYPQNKTVPESWKPFNFNGMHYYIIPVDEATRLNRP